VYEDGQKTLCTIFGRLNVVVDMFHKTLGCLNVPIDTVCDLQVPSHNHQTLFFCERVQLQHRIFDLASSRQLLQKFFCAMVSKEERYGEWFDSLIRLSVIAFVESARIESSCAMIFPSNSVKSSVNGISV
jgi:hypothetical protein